MLKIERQLGRFRFGLRALLACTFVLACILAWFACLLSEGRRHAWIAAELRAAGCEVRFSHRERVVVANPPMTTLPGGGTAMEERSTLPGLMERLGFAVAARRIEHITIRERAELPAAIELLKQIGDFDGISLYDTGITQAQLTDAFSNVRVKTIYARGEQMPRTGLSWLNHDGLRWLCLNRTQLSNPAIDDLPGSLEYFDATRTRINDEGLNAFVRLKNLKTLILRRTPTSQGKIDALRQRMPWCEIKWEPLTES